MNRKAESGIGTLIVFIAMILVAAVAAGVLIQTSSSLQSKSLDIGKKTQSEVSSGLEVVQVLGFREGSGTVRNLTFMVKLTAGSSAIKFDDTTLSLLLKDKVMKYGQGTGLICNGSDATIFSCNYTVSYALEASSGHLTGYLVPGDIAEVTLIAPREIEEAEEITSIWMPKLGISRETKFSTPNSISKDNVLLYP